MVSSGTGQAFELPPFFHKEFLSPEEPNRPQEVVVTSSCGVITSGPEKCVKREIPAFGITIKLENVHKVFQTLDY